jgi:hypothetical protein
MCHGTKKNASRLVVHLSPTLHHCPVSICPQPTKRISQVQDGLWSILHVQAMRWLGRASGNPHQLCLLPPKRLRLRLMRPTTMGFPTQLTRMIVQGRKSHSPPFTGTSTSTNVSLPRPWPPFVVVVIVVLLLCCRRPCLQLRRTHIHWHAHVHT